MNTPKGTLTAFAWTPEGVIYDYYREPIDSYVEQWIQIASAVWGNQDISNVTDVGGTDRTVESGGGAASTFNFKAVDSDDFTFGLVIGSDGTSETITDTSLASSLSSSADAADTVVGTTSVSAPSAFLDITRTFTNTSGGQLTVREAGIIARHDDNGGTAREFLVLRDTGSPIATFNDGDNLTLEYEIEITV